jgi:peptidoglycan/LPS O-acetylase OafA/YrhL
LLYRESIGTRLQRFNGIGPGFDFLRVALAVTIIINHSFLIVEGNFDYVKAHRLWAVFGLTLPMFFSLSGFLIAASAQRLRLRDFLLNRALRIRARSCSGHIGVGPDHRANLYGLSRAGLLL